MKQSRIYRLLLLTLFDWELAGKQHQCDDIKSILHDLKRVARKLQQRSMVTDDPQARHIIKQKQQILHLRRKKTLILLRKCYQQRRRK